MVRSYTRLDDDNIHLDIYSGSSLIQQFTGQHVFPLRHIILISSQLIFSLALEHYVLSREAVNISDVTLPGIKPMNYKTSGKHTNYYNTESTLSDQKFGSEDF